jgi:hypothetical protein
VRALNIPSHPEYQNKNKKSKEKKKQTGKDLIDQTMAFFSGTYFTLPAVALNRPESASDGTGIITSTLFAVERRLN